MENIQAFPCHGHGETNGMNLKDYFAGQALVGITAAYISGNVVGGTPYGHAVAAYAVADAMLKERAKQEGLDEQQ